MEQVDRENEILRILEVLSKAGIDFVLVGGYAVSALARHRFSVDCDLIVRKRDLENIESLLQAEGFAKTQQRDGFDKVYSGKFVRYERRVSGLAVSADLLVDSLVSRDTEGSWSFEYISSHSVEANIPGIQYSVKCRIPNREILLAFKLHSARRADVRDVVMLSEEADWDKVFGHLNRGDPALLEKSIRQVLQYLEDSRLIDSLKGRFSLKEDVKPSIAKSAQKVRTILGRLRKTAE